MISSVESNISSGFEMFFIISIFVIPQPLFSRSEVWVVSHYANQSQLSTCGCVIVGEMVIICLIPWGAVLCHLGVILSPCSDTDREERRFYDNATGMMWADPLQITPDIQQDHSSWLTEAEPLVLNVPQCVVYLKQLACMWALQTQCMCHLTLQPINCLLKRPVYEMNAELAFKGSV